MNIGQALKEAKSGRFIYRTSWKDIICVVHQKGYPQGIPCNAQIAKAWGVSEGDLFKCAPYLQAEKSDAMHIMYFPSEEDLAAIDWVATDRIKERRERMLC